MKRLLGSLVKIQMHAPRKGGYTTAGLSMRFELSLRKCGSCRVTSERLIVKKESDKDTQKKHRENAVVSAVVALFLRVDSSCGAGAPSPGRDTLDLLSTWLQSHCGNPLPALPSSKLPSKEGGTQLTRALGSRYLQRTSCCSCFDTAHSCNCTWS